MSHWSVVFVVFVVYLQFVNASIPAVEVKAMDRNGKFSGVDKVDGNKMELHCWSKSNVVIWKVDFQSNLYDFTNGVCPNVKSGGRTWKLRCDCDLFITSYKHSYNFKSIGEHLEDYMEKYVEIAKTGAKPKEIQEKLSKIIKPASSSGKIRTGKIRPGRRGRGRGRERGRGKKAVRKVSKKKVQKKSKGTKRYGFFNAFKWQVTTLSEEDIDEYL